MSAASPPPDTGGTVFDEVELELARTYAEALLGAARKTGEVEAVLDELDEVVADIWLEKPEFAALLSSPVVSAVDKGRILNEAFGGRALPIIGNFFGVLNHHGRLGLVQAIAAEARALWDRSRGHRPVHVRSAVPLDADQIESLRAKLAPLIHGTPILQFEVDPALIGGLVIQADDVRFDASVRNQFLARFRRRLIEEKTHDILARRENYTTA